MENKDVLLDVGYCLPYCGHRVIERVWQGIRAGDKVFYVSENNKRQYMLPIDAIEFVVPHEEERNNNENCYKTNTVLL